MSKLEERAQRVQREAQARVERLCNALRAEGWHFVAIQLAMIVAEDGNCASPGASSLDADATAMGPALPHQAEALRHLASLTDEAFRRLDIPEAPEGYREEIINLQPQDRRRR